VIQEALAAATVAVAALYLLYKLVLAPGAHARRPDVPAARLVRKR
jgi:hypothetical protein